MSYRQSSRLRNIRESSIPSIRNHQHRSVNDDFNASNLDGLVQASADNRISDVENILTDYEYSNDYTEQTIFQNSLIAAVRNNNPEIIYILLSNFSYSVEFLLNVLIQAKIEQKQGIIDALFISDVLEDGKVLTAAIENGYYDIAKTLLRQGIRPEFAILAKMVNIGDIYAVQFLLENNVTPRSPTALANAVKNNDIDMVELLLPYGADVNFKNGALLNIAAKRGYMDMVKLLVKNGGDFRLNNYRARQRAEEYNHEDIATYLSALELADDYYD